MKKTYHIFFAIRNMNLRQKMFIGYFLLVALPSLLFIFFLLENYQAQRYDRYLADEQKSLQQNNANFVSRLSQTEGYQLLFQKERALTRYLTGYYKTESDELFYYLSEIQPLFSYLLSSDKQISDLQVHALTSPLVPLPTGITFDESQNGLMTHLPAKGKWELSHNEAENLYQLTFYIPLFTTDYFRRIGLLEISLTDKITSSFFTAKDPRCSRFLLVEDVWYYYDFDSLHPVQDYPGQQELLHQYLKEKPGHQAVRSWKSRTLLVNEIEIDVLDGMLISITPAGKLYRLVEYRWPLLAIFLLFILLSIIYYILISSFTRRLLLFSQHIDKTDYDSLNPFQTKSINDEIGKVITAYNGSVQRVRNLLDDLNISEMKKNESDYFMLQAQMNPHFIYNSLETARMMAEINDNEEVADFIFNLGSVVRYSFSSASKEISLQEEIETTRKYLEIYFASSGGNISYTIQKQEDFSTVFCPPFILQPLVENSIHHGTNPQSHSILIQLTVKREYEKILILVEDNGIGIDSETLSTIQNVCLEMTDTDRIRQKRTGLGLRSVIKRLRDYYGDSVSISVESAPKTGTLFTISLDL